MSCFDPAFGWLERMKTMSSSAVLQEDVNSLLSSLLLPKLFPFFLCPCPLLFPIISLSNFIARSRNWPTFLFQESVLKFLVCSGKKRELHFVLLFFLFFGERKKAWWLCILIYITIRSTRLDLGPYSAPLHCRFPTEGQISVISVIQNEIIAALWTSPVAIWNDNLACVCRIVDFSSLHWALCLHGCATALIWLWTQLPGTQNLNVWTVRHVNLKW